MVPRQNLNFNTNIWSRTNNYSKPIIEAIAQSLNKLIFENSSELKYNSTVLPIKISTKVFTKILNILYIFKYHN